MMRRKSLAIFISGGLLTAGAAFGLRSVPEAHSQSQPAPAVTPKMQAPPEARVLARAFTSVAKAMRPSVVRIDVEQAAARGTEGLRRGGPRRGDVPPELREFLERFFGEDGPGGGGLPSPGPAQGTGSGFVFDGAGHIITNSHVVKDASKVTVTFADGREFPAQVVGSDDQTDIAVVKLEKSPGPLTVARLGDPERLEVGEWVLAVGSPLGMDQTVTAGIVSGKGKVGRNVPRMSGEKVREYIQTDAKINPGNSGGPLVNLDGEVVGINTLINVGAGGAYGFAIPVNQARRVAEVLIREGRMRYAYLGVQVGDIRDVARNEKDKLPKGAPERGAIVTTVLPDTPAAKAGVRPGDVITRIDQEPIEAHGDVVAYISARPIGSQVTLNYVREGRPNTVKVTLEELPGKDGQARAAAGGESQGMVGVQLQTLTPDVAQFLGLDRNTKGAVVAEVVPGSRAAKAGLQAEDVIVEVNRKPIATAEEASRALREGGKAPLMVKVRRNGAARLITVPGP